MKIFRRLQYYICNVVEDGFIPFIFQRDLHSTINHFSMEEIYSSFDRVNYNNKLDSNFVLSDPISLNGVGKFGSMYYYDLKEYFRYFTEGLGLSYIFGDVTEVPSAPSIVKSRPINGDNSNSVILNLDKFRHYYTIKDRLDFRAKIPRAVWRGRDNNFKRRQLVEGFHDHPLCDVGLVNGNLPEKYMKPWLSMREQLQYRYILSIEGIDVATNLKWIMSSKSLCMMPKCIYETWFMEGRLVPGFHFVLLKDDFSDLSEKIEYYNKHPFAAEEIIKNANNYCAVFFDKRNEKLVSLLILMKYFFLSGQMELPDRLKDLPWR